MWDPGTCCVQCALSMRRKLALSCRCNVYYREFSLAHDYRACVDIKSVIFITGVNGPAFKKLLLSCNFYNNLIFPAFKANLLLPWKHTSCLNRNGALVQFFITTKPEVSVALRAGRANGA